MNGANPRSTPQAPNPAAGYAADLADAHGKRREPIHPDDIDDDGSPLDNSVSEPRNPLADSPDDCE